jgi:hypothetical protein
VLGDAHAAKKGLAANGWCSFSIEERPSSKDLLSILAFGTIEEVKRVWQTSLSSSSTRASE